MYLMNGMCCAGLMVLGLLAAVGFGLVLVALVVAMLVKRWRKKAPDSSAAARVPEEHAPVFQDVRRLSDSAGRHLPMRPSRNVPF